MIVFKRIVFVFTFVLASMAGVAHAEKLKVGTSIAPPFVMKEDGKLKGISIELFERVANQMNLEYEWVETDLKSLLKGVQDGSLDLSVAALTVTPAREAVLDFSHPFYSTGLSIATRGEPNGIWGAFKNIFSAEFLYAIAGLGALLLLVGGLLWLAERGRNPEQFGGTPLQGVGSGFWWAAVTMTTVGYGDKAPATLAGRIIGLVWMFAAIILISGFTAAIATSLTVKSLDMPVNGIDDLARVQVATVGASSSAEFLDSENIRYRSVANVTDALNLLDAGKVEAVVYDAPLLQFLANSKFEGRLQVLPETFKRQDYAFALPTGSSLREPINQNLLSILADDEWPAVVQGYLGQ